ncbi:hypothetical protein [Natronolimnohabitans innermongolicus]|uniref:Uncharacterized protein n=1 Tax=Natronolimnohabitans innermongolicus JCM 12255 TaxID=1227499 RepID=L9WV05_9EURY|nr:hypothetical protein [Natronolimnohabitans innermongolicus]ELY53290.1 hypothetical protein C493_14708 [Natronolimnohabitans innermongolicus JCM 12255]
MYGILTDDLELARTGPGEFTHFFAEYVDGTRQDPLEDAINSVACWGDTATVREDPARAALGADGTRATPDAEGHDWGTVCPTDSDYRAALLERIERVGAAGDVRLTTLGFPGETFCRCKRCDRRFEASEYDDRDAWRTAVITAFVADAAERVASDLLATLYPDPYPGNLRERAGLDPAALESHVDGFVVPLCGVGYGTTYWVESLARGFARELGDLEATLTIQLSAAGVDAERLAGLTRRLEPHADAFVYGTYPGDAETVRATIDLLSADEPRLSV